jgi:hypothetical protein
MLWSRHTAEQERLLTTGVSNTFEGTSGRPQVGVYVNDNGSDKLTYYLGMATTVRSNQCFDGFVQELTTTTTLVSNAPPNVKQLPLSIIGFGPLATPIRGNLKLGVMIAGPKAGIIESMTVDGQAAPLGRALLNGRQVVRVARELPPGQSSVIVTKMRTAAASPGDPELHTTPGIQPSLDRAGPSSCG